MRVAHALARAGLEALLIGNAAAALHGAPVTTLDLDFMFRKTPANMRKLKVFAEELNAMILRPYCPVSDLFRVVGDDLGLQVDFMATIHRVRTFESLRSRAVALKLADTSLSVAALRDIVRSDRAAGRPKDYAVLEILRPRSMKAKKRRRPPTRAQRLAALAVESDRALREQIRRLLALPMEKRTHFLRVRIGRGSAL